MSFKKTSITPASLALAWHSKSHSPEVGLQNTKCMSYVEHCLLVSGARSQGPVAKKTPGSPCLICQYPAAVWCLPDSWNGFH